MKNENDEFLPEGDYRCTSCRKITKHEYSNNLYLSGSTQPKRSFVEIVKRETRTPLKLSCTQCGNELD